MRPIERRLGEVAEVMAGMTGLGDVGNYRYGVVQPNSFSDTGTIGAVEWQKRNDEVSEKQKLMVGDILVKRLNPSFVHVPHVCGDGSSLHPTRPDLYESKGDDANGTVC